MTTSYVSRKVKVAVAKAFRDSFKESIPKRVGYIFLSKSLPYDDEEVIPSTLSDTILQEKEIWDNMILGKRVVSKDIELVIPRYNWIPGLRFKQYDDTAILGDLLTTDQDGDQTIYPMYVMNSSGNVYKCLSNNASGVSNVEPIGTYTENDGFFQTDTDGEPDYLWKYMYNVRISNKFLTSEWMPVPYIQANTEFTDYNFSTSNLIDGALNKIEVIDSGSGYYHTEVNVSAFVAGSNTLTITDDIDLSTSNTVNVNMLISGTGLLENSTYITQIDDLNPTTLYLSENTITSGGGTGNTISITTRVLIEGDGSETVTSVTLANNTIEYIDVTNAGIGFSRANVTVYGSGTGATARAILPPKFGHGYNPAKELDATNVMILSRIGEIDATENTKIPVDIDFRQYGLIINPYKYDDDVMMTENTALDVISQTLDVVLLSFTGFNINEMVYQGDINNPDFVGYVVQQDIATVQLNNIYKTPIVGSLLTGASSGSQNIIVSYENPDLKPYAGDILYARNILAVQRSLAQSEEIKLVFQF
jgi:hypothetical protein